ncbi:MAG: DUF2971 domain-containing protein [Prolixibacteraceae bacterium]|jgi:hypothetical protein|nr:DUF2971 domain-containing protein [Prolixibacteraceae bacterium]
MSKLNTDIFKFTSIEVGELIVAGKLLKFNDPEFFNDPFDCDIDLLEFDFNNRSPEISNELEKVKTILEKNYGEKTERLINTISDSEICKIYKQSQLNKISRSSICCFSTSFKNTVMWSHYGDKHRGVCLNFDWSIPEPFVDYPTERFSKGPVDYNHYHTPVNYLKSKEEGIKKLFYTKSEDWRYENEFRFHILEEHGLFRFNHDFLKGIIFGIRVSEKEIERFKKICAKHGFSSIYFKKLIKDKLNIRIEQV